MLRRLFVAAAVTLAAGCPSRPPDDKRPEPKPGRGETPKGSPERKRYASAKELEATLKGKTKAEVVSLLGKPQEGKRGASCACDIWRYENRNPSWRVED